MDGAGRGCTGQQIDLAVGGWAAVDLAAAQQLSGRLPRRGASERQERSLPPACFVAIQDGTNADSSPGNLKSRGDLAQCCAQHGFRRGGRTFRRQDQGRV
ncbi:hypothetical protein ACFQU7_39765 [Pseudoroseomonas wenyumeiae]